MMICRRERPKGKGGLKKASLIAKHVGGAVSCHVAAAAGFFFIMSPFLEEEGISRFGRLPLGKVILFPLLEGEEIFDD